MDIRDIRRRNLRLLVQEHANGNLSRFVEFTLNGLTSYKGLQLVTGPREGRNLGTALARKIEAQLHLERGWMDHDRSGTVHTGVVPGGRSERVALLAESIESLSPPIRRVIEQLVALLRKDVETLGSMRGHHAQSPHTLAATRMGPPPGTVRCNSRVGSGRG